MSIADHLRAQAKEIREERQPKYFIDKLPRTERAAIIRAATILDRKRRSSGKGGDVNTEAVLLLEIGKGHNRDYHTQEESEVDYRG